MRSLITPRRAVHEITRPPDGMYRGRLAEDYDGIGQYVMVSLSSAAVGSAYKARIASGDFNGGRTFPAGTPVHLSSFHGQIEVFLGNLPGCPCGDNFNRSEDPGLGESRLGIYTYPGGPSSQLSVDGSAGVFELLLDPQGRLTSPEPIEFPFEVLFKMQAVGASSFLGWNGSGAGGFDAIQFFFEVAVTDNFPYGLVAFSTFGTFPNTVMGFSQDDSRTSLGSQDFNDITRSWPESQQEVDFFFRFLMDDFGTYGRLWLIDEDEPKSVSDGLVIPFSGSAAWLATGGGKEEAWSVYEACVEGFEKPEEFFLFTFGSNGVAGTNPLLRVDEFCIIQGGWC